MASLIRAARGFQRFGEPARLAGRVNGGRIERRGRDRGQDALLETRRGDNIADRA